MDARDLLIGDWVALKSDKTPIKVETNLGGAINIEHSYFSGEYEGGIYDEDLEPIPLTEDILEENGFEIKIDPYSNRKYFLLGKNVYNMDVYYDNGSILLVEEQYEPKMYAYFCECEYVHKLQHVLKDLEIEKEIIL